MISSRPYYLLLTVGCIGLLGYGYYLQFYQDLEPCPLCIFQRIAYIAVIIFATIGLIHGPKGIGLRIYSSLVALSALIGAGIAGRQVWLQHLPADQVPACGPDLGFMLDAFPLTETIQMVFTGSGECAEVDWTFLTLSIAEWSLICFSLIVITSIVHAIRKKIFYIF
jgi:disulfide bond formation protein DsbB